MVLVCRFLVCCECKRRTDNDGNETTAMTDDWDLRPSCYTRRGYTETDDRLLSGPSILRNRLIYINTYSAFPQTRNLTIDAEETFRRDAQTSFLGR